MKFALHIDSFSSPSPLGTSALSNFFALGHTWQKMEPPTKKPRRMLLDDRSSEDESGEHLGGVTLDNADDLLRQPSFKINEEYARRFEHNKKREELQHCTF